jgi:hypothetical protein
MECLYPTECINIVSHLDNNINKRNSDDTVDLPDLKRLKISDHSEVVVQSSKRLKTSDTSNISINIEKKLKISKEEPKKNKVLAKIETIEKKLRLFKMCTAKYIDHLQDELDELKCLVE